MRAKSSLERLCHAWGSRWWWSEQRLSVDFGNFFSTQLKKKKKKKKKTKPKGGSTTHEQLGMAKPPPNSGWG
jgi:hypothetical protein